MTHPLPSAVLFSPKLNQLMEVKDQPSFDSRSILAISLPSLLIT